MGHRVVVTGAGGSLASSLLPKLCALPEVDSVIGLDVRAPDLVHDKLTFHQADVTDPAIRDHFAGADALFHLAFIVERGSRDHARVQAVNVDGSVNVLEGAAEAGIAHVIYASSVAAYGSHPENQGQRLDESAPIRGNEDFYYSRTKAEVERWLDDYEQRPGAPAVARLRPSAFLGRTGRSVDRLQSRFLPSFGGAGQPVHVTHQDDVADAFLLAYQKGARGAFNIATEEPLNAAEIARQTGKVRLPLPRATVKALELSYDRGWIDIDPSWFTALSSYPIAVSAEKARRELGWRPQYDTTADVMRELCGVPTTKAAAQTKLLFGGLATMTRFRGGLPAGDELPSFTGDIDLCLTGEHPSRWHLSVSTDKLGVLRGGSPAPRATVAMSEHTLYQLFSGERQFLAAKGAGLIRVRGDADGTAIVTNFCDRLGAMLRGEAGHNLPGPLRRWLLAPAS